MLLLPSADFLKKFFEEHIRVSNSFDPVQDRHFVVQDRHFVGPELGPIVCKGYQEATFFIASSEEKVRTPGVLLKYKNDFHISF